MASIDNVPVSLFLSNARTDTLPIRMWGMMESTLDVRVAAVSGVLIARRLRADADHGMDGGPHPPHARLGSDLMEIEPQPLTRRPSRRSAT